jgi:hypothetical protein
MNKLKIANLYYSKSRAITPNKTEKNPHAKTQVHSFTVMMVIIPVI